MRNNSLLRRYGLAGALRLVIDVILTRFTFKGGRLVRRPIYLRGAYAMSIGRRFTSGPGLRLDAFPVEPGIVLAIGDDVQVNDYVHIAAIKHVSIGTGTLIASRVFISDHNHGTFDGSDPANGADVAPALRPLWSKPVNIGRNVWLGEQVCILPGVTIGDGAVVGAGAVVTRDIPAGCVAAGNPARVLRQYDPITCQWRRV